MTEATLMWGMVGGIASLFCFMLMAKKIEGMWFSPGAVFAFAYVCHAFVSPVSMFESENSTFRLDNLATLQTYSFVCFFALGAGYLVGAAGALRGHQGAYFPTRLSPQGTTLCAATLMTCVAIIIAYSITAGTFTEGKGAWAYSADASIWGRTKALAALLIVPLYLTLLTSITTFSGSRRKFLFWVLVICMGCLLIHSLLTFARHLIAQLIMVTVIYYHFRVSKIRAWHIAATLAMLFLVSLFAGIRIFGDGVMNLSASEIMDQLALSLQESSNPFKFLLSIAGAIAGQDVFSQVLAMVPGQEPYRYGMTYLESLASILTPRLITGDYEIINTPAFWFKDAYAPYTINHGFDFSMLSEAYLNFGPMMWVPYLVLGFVVARISGLIRYTSSQLTLVIAIVIVLGLITGLRTDSNAMFKTMVLMPMPVLVLFFFARWKFQVRAPHSEQLLSARHFTSTGNSAAFKTGNQ